MKQSSRTLGPLKFKRRKHPTQQLPYVGTEFHAPKYGHCLWDIPLTGDYTGGWKTGQALSLIALKHVKATSAEPVGHLGSVASSWLDRVRGASHEEFETLRAQVLGFMSAVEAAVIGGLVHAGYDTEAWDLKALLKEANQGLAHRDPEEWKR